MTNKYDINNKYLHVFNAVAMHEIKYTQSQKNYFGSQRNLSSIKLLYF